MSDNSYNQTVFMPDGKPAPFVLTPEEAIKFLRIEDVSHPENTLAYYQEKKLLYGTYIGKRRFYTVSELVDFVERVTKKGRCQDDRKGRNLPRPA